MSIFVRIAFFSLLVATVGSAAYFLPPKFSQMKEYEKQRYEYLRKIEHKKSEVDALKLKQYRFLNNPVFVEYIARQNRRVRPNELLFVIENDTN